MFETVIAALIAAAASIACQLILSGSASRKDAEERAARRQKLDDDIKTLTQRVDEHNSYAALFARQTASLAGLCSDIRLMQKDIEYIKEGRFNGRVEE